jgi:hypothetical protein
MRGLRLGAWGLARGTWGLGFLLVLGVTTSAQPPASPLPVPGSRIEVEPIRCWRQATSGAVTIGESFRVILTCAVFESTDAQVVPDESRLNLASIQMAPFEIIGGTHPPDVRRGGRRFFQYEYDVRIISRDAIGQDVNVPPLTISYRVHSRVGAAAKLEGRDLSYVLPALPIKVLSLVPADATDIRDAAEASLASVDALRSRSRRFEVIAVALGALAVVIAVLALVPVARRAGAIGKGDRDVIPDRAILKSAAASLQDTQKRAIGDGWNDEAIASALAAMRLVSAVALDRPISRKPLPPDGVAPEGRLRVDHGVLRRSAVTVSSGVTAIDVATTPRLDRLRESLAVLTSAMYRRSPERDAAAIDAAVRQSIDMANEFAAERSWVSRLRQRFGARESRWARR